MPLKEEAMEPSVVLVVHGSALPESGSIYKEIAAKASEKSGMRVVVGYMKHGRPTIAEAVASLVEEGIKKIVIVPLFFVPGLHVVDDIPHLLGLKRGGSNTIKFPKDVDIIYARHIGADDRLAEVVVDRVREAVG